MQDPIIIEQWFDLYQLIKVQYNRLDKNIYIDKNGYIIDIARISKVIFAKY